MESKIIELFNAKGDELVASDLEDSDFMWQAVFKIVSRLNPLTAKILDIGSGKGKYVGKLQALGFNITGVEPAEKLIQDAHQLYPKAEFVKGTATEIPYADNTVDCILCIEVLEHIPNTEKAIQEMCRVLKPTGQLIIIDKNIHSWHYLYFVPTSIWKYTKEHLNQWMYPANFGFREKYFVPDELLELIKKYFHDAGVKYIRYFPISKRRSLTKRAFLFVHGFLSRILYRFFPRASFYVMWQGTKKYYV